MKAYKDIVQTCLHSTKYEQKWIVLVPKYTIDTENNIQPHIVHSEECHLVWSSCTGTYILQVVKQASMSTYCWWNNMLILCPTVASHISVEEITDSCPHTFHPWWQLSLTLNLRKWDRNVWLGGNSLTERAHHLPSVT